jgi:hypothetical protein
MVVRGTVDSPVATVCGWPNVQAMTLSETHNPRRTRLAVAGFAALTVLFLVGCSSTVEPRTSVFSREAIPAEATPMFASDEEAAAAAELAYRNYIDVSDQIARDGGANVERLKPFVTPSFYLQVVEEFSFFSKNGAQSSGSTGMDSFKIQSLQLVENRLGIVAYVCLDVTENLLINAAGADVTPIGRASRVPLEILITVDPAKANLVLLSGSDVWTGINFC